MDGASATAAPGAAPIFAKKLDRLIPVSLTSYSESRSELRYGLHLPVRVSREDTSDGEMAALSENICAHGILLRAGVSIAEGTILRMVITVKAEKASKTTRLLNAGRVLRVTPCRTSGFLIAIRCVRPFRMAHAASQED